MRESLLKHNRADVVSWFVSQEDSNEDLSRGIRYSATDSSTQMLRDEPRKLKRRGIADSITETIGDGGKKLKSVGDEGWEVDDLIEWYQHSIVCDLCDVYLIDWEMFKA